jgi:hypothetical protein
MAATADGDQGARVPRTIDLFRHLDDVRLRSYEGAGPRADRNKVFERAVELIDPLVMGILEETREVFLDGHGDVSFAAPDDDGTGGMVATWNLSWPEQRAGVNRHEPPESASPIEPIKVIAWFGATFTHWHLAGAGLGHWPLQVVDAGDAARQEPILRAIVEAELHQRIYEGGWQILPGYAKLHT